MVNMLKEQLYEKFSSGNIPECLILIDKILSLAPNDLLTHKIQIAIHSDFDSDHYDIDRAIVSATSLLEVYPHSLTIRILHALLEKENLDYEKSKFLFESIIDMDPCSYDALVEYAEVLAYLDKIKFRTKIIDSFTFAIRMDPTNYRAYYSLGYYYESVKEIDKSILYNTLAMETLGKNSSMFIESIKDKLRILSNPNNEKSNILANLGLNPDNPG